MFTRLWNKLRSLRRDDGFERDLTEELDFHRAMLEHDNARRGLDADGAASAARRKIGNVTIAYEDARRVWVFGWFEDVARDLRLAFRSYRRSPGFALAAILVLALGLGANMAVFRFVDAAVFETLPVPRPHELVLVGGRSYSYPAFQQLAAGTTDVLAATAARTSERANLTVDGYAEYLDVEVVSGGYFDTLGVRPAIGRLLRAEDDGAEGAHRVCVISHRLWLRLFGGTPDVIGKTVQLHAEPFEIVGVTEPAFEGSVLHSRYDMQVPLSMRSTIGGNPRDSYGARYLVIIGRLAAGVSLQQAESVIRGRYDALEQPGTSPLTVRDGRQGLGRSRYRLLDTAVAAQTLSLFVLVLACASLAGLLLARVSSRLHEMAVRAALGASRFRLVSQSAIETAGLVLAGGIVAIAVAVALDGALIRMLTVPGSVLDIRAVPSWRGLGAAFVVTTIVAAVVGLLPALSATRRLPIHNLRDTERVTGGRSRLGASLVVVQIAACLALIFGAGLLAKTLYSLRTIDLGIDPASVVVMTAGPGQRGYTRATEARFYDEWLRRAQRTPGVTSASLAAITAMSESMFAMAIDVPGAVPRDTSPNDNFNIVTPDYFRTVGLPLVGGRAFTDADTAQSERVAIVNEQFVAHYWPGESPIGRQFGRGNNRLTIVGLVRTARYQAVKEEPQIVVYVPHAQQPWGGMTLHAKVADGFGTAALVQAARDIDPAVPIYDVSTLGAHLDARLANERVLNATGLFFGVLALAVAAAGLYGTVAYTVSRRTREIGIRTAVGAQRRDIIALFVGRTFWLVAAGIAIGVPAALMAGRSLEGVLYGVEPTSPSILVAAALLLGTVALTAAVVPALQGARVDPVRALRVDA